MALPKKKILVVDDEIDFLTILKKRLEVKGFEVVTAYDAARALELLRQGGIDAAIVDIMMPGMDGITLLRKIRSENQDLPVFVATAFSNEERFQAATLFNASGFIFKGSDLAREVDNIASLLAINDQARKKD